MERYRDLILNVAGKNGLYFLDRRFHGFVLAGGIVLFVLAAIRGVTLWISVGKPKAAAHHHDDHEHYHDHSHEHVHVHLPVVEDDHGHEHGWAPWRYAVMIVPVTFWMLGIPSKRADLPEQGDFRPMTQHEAGSEAARWKVMDDGERAAWKKDMDTQKVRLRGLNFSRFDNKTIVLGRMQMTCCIGDAYPVSSRVLVEAEPNLIDQQPRNRWIRVIGKLDVRKAPSGSEEFVAVLHADTVESIGEPANPYNP